MSKKQNKTPKYRGSVSPWYTDIAKDRAILLQAGYDEESAAIVALDKKLVEREAQLKARAKLLRQYASGFTPSEGYDIARIRFWPMDRIKAVDEYGQRLEQEETQGRVTVKPRGAKQRAAVEQHTGQTQIPRRKKFNVFTFHPDKTKVKLVPSRRKVRGKAVTEYRIEVGTQTKRGELYDRYFYLPPNLNTFKDVERETRKLLRFMPNGYYVMISNVYGEIARGMPKSAILRELSQSWQAYDLKPGDKGLAGTITGFKLVGFQAEDETRRYKEQLTWREAMRRSRAAQKRKEKAARLKKYGII